jgi:cyclopropane fatty-acyl-phospholipid synthase-like methyltransferase/methyltransferase-like protein
MTSSELNDASARTAASYDDFPYDSAALYETQPAALSVAATLLGMDPAPVERCRVLEIGCATGHNLIAMAQISPESTFVGIDLSPRQIAIGTDMATAVGLGNVELRALDLARVDDSLGQFDYITCHGVYSWVPPEVQTKLLEICSRRLSAHGVAYMSYNTYPGWHMRVAAREAMLYASRRAANAREKVRQARSYLDQLARQSSYLGTAYDKSLNELATWMRDQKDSYVFHDYLEEVNLPLYFHEFVERLGRHGLRHMGEPCLARGLDSASPEARGEIKQLTPDLIEQEQFADFAINRSFRRSLIGHQGVGLAVPHARYVEKLHVTTLARPVSATPDVTSAASEDFREKNDLNLATNEPLLKAALVVMFEIWPVALSFDELCQAVERKLAGVRGPLDATARGVLAGHLLSCYRAEFVALHPGPLPFLTRVNERPRGSRLAQYQARSTADVVNLRHRNVSLPDFPRLVLLQLNGEHDEAGLVQLMERAIDDGRLPLDPQYRSLTPQSRREMLTNQVHGSLDYLMRAALLVK